MLESASPCPCGLPSTYENCCKPHHDGKKSAESAEKLMRSRYSAYVAGKIDYIAQTNLPSAKDDFDREAAEQWSKKSEWLGLQIVAVRDGKPGDKQGDVEFKAKYNFEGKETVHHEVSVFEFDRDKRCWYYCDGKTIQAPIQRAEPKIGRNDPCSCGSGKKFKKCCAVAE